MLVARERGVQVAELPPTVPFNEQDIRLVIDDLQREVSGVVVSAGLLGEFIGPDPIALSAFVLSCQVELDLLARVFGGDHFANRLSDRQPVGVELFEVDSHCLAIETGGADGGLQHRLVVLEDRRRIVQIRNRQVLWTPLGTDQHRIDRCPTRKSFDVIGIARVGVVPAIRQQHDSCELQSLALGGGS